MAGSVNKVILIGHLGRDPEARAFQNGNRVVSFSIATTESWRDKATGERKDKTEWHNVQVFNEKIGKIAEQYLRKGSKVYIEGQLQTRKYTDKDGAERQTTEIVLQNFKGQLTLLESAKQDDQPEREAPERKPVVEYYKGDNPPRGAPVDDDIPF